jgi:small subunit ribosomal protein S13
MSIDQSFFTSQSDLIIKSLRKCFGIGFSNATSLLLRFGISPFLKTKEIPQHKISKIIEFSEKHLVLSERLRYKQIESVRKLIFIKSYRGVRISKGLPVHGQRTKSNGKTPKKMKKLGLYHL